MKRILDPRLIPPTELHAVKTDSLYQRKREKLHAYRLIEFPLGTDVNGTQYPCSTWDYMSIYTDGAINEENIKRVPPADASALTIEFNDEEIYIIKGETDTPIPLIKKQWFRLWNETTGGQPENHNVETGYGNCKILLHNYPYHWNLKKHNPQVCHSFSLGDSASEEFWIGMNRSSGTWTQLAPNWIPKGYKDIIIWLTSNATLDPRLNLRFYPDCCEHYHEKNYSPMTDTPVELDGYGICRRVYLEVINQDATDREFNLMVQWGRGSGNFGR